MRKRPAFYNENVQTKRVDLTLPGLEALGNHLARFPGRKNIVWVGNGMPLYIGARGRAGRETMSRVCGPPQSGWPRRVLRCIPSRRG